MFNKRDIANFSFDYFARVENALPATQYIYIYIYSANKFSTGRN